ncbi:MAG: hypothetical protein P8Y66_05900, partial [Nitrospirota bacterium]
IALGRKEEGRGALLLQSRSEAEREKRGEKKASGCLAGRGSGVERQFSFNHAERKRGGRKGHLDA